MKKIFLLILISYKVFSQQETDSISYNYLFVTDSNIISKIVYEPKDRFNPFGPITTFSFKIPYTMNTKISLYKGKEKTNILFDKLLFESILDSGNYKIEFDYLSKSESGFYFLKFEQPDTLFFQKLILVK